MDRPFAVLAPVEPTIGPERKIHTVTGERGSGKSTVCARVAWEARANGLVVAGIITEEVTTGARLHPAGQPRPAGATGEAPPSPRHMVDLRTGERRPFGSRNRAPGGAGAGHLVNGPDHTGGRDHTLDATSAAHHGSPTADPLTPGWSYDPGVFEWGNEVLRRAIPCDLLVIDELGPIEILGGRGWSSAFEVLSTGDYDAALVVCRPALVDRLHERVGTVRGEIYEVRFDNRDELPAVILRGLLVGGKGRG